MADNYLEFSEIIENLSEEEKAWIRNIPAGRDYEEEEDFYEALEEYGIEPGPDLFVEEFPYFSYTIEQRDGQSHWWIYSGSYGNVDHVIVLVQAFIRKFRPDYIFSLTYSESCSKPRVGEFGGGWVVVTKDDVFGDNAYREAREKVQELKEARRC